MKRPLTGLGFFVVAKQKKAPPQAQEHKNEKKHHCIHDVDDCKQEGFGETFA